MKFGDPGVGIAGGLLAGGLFAGGLFAGGLFGGGDGLYGFVRGAFGGWVGRGIFRAARILVSALGMEVEGSPTSGITESLPRGLFFGLGLSPLHDAGFADASHRPSGCTPCRLSPLRSDSRVPSDLPC